MQQVAKKNKVKKMQNNKIKVKNLFKFLAKSKHKAGEGLEYGQYPFYTSSATVNKYFDEYDFESNKLIFATGGSASVHYAKSKFAVSTDNFVLEPFENVNAKYVYYYLKSNIQILQDGFHGAGLQHLSKDYLSEIGIPMLNSTEQQKIVSILDKADEIRTKKKKANEKLDEFLKSTFIDMFGNPRTNNKNWSKNTLEGIVANDKHSIKRGPFGGSLKKEIFKESGYLVYEQTHAIHNDYNFARYYIDERKYKEMEIFKVVPGDLIISCSGVTLGRISEIPQNAVPGIINQALLKISLNPEIVDNKYFIALFRNRYVQNKIFELSRGSGIPNMPSISVLKQLQFMIPPIELQNNFAQIVEKGKSQKQKNEEVIKQMDNLFNSLSQKAFKGEL